MSETTYSRRNKEIVLNREKYYDGNNKELLRDKSQNNYRELSEENKNIKRQYGRNRSTNVSEEKKERLKEYQRNSRRGKKMNINFF